MGRTQAGRAWSVAEEEMLLDELRGDATLAEIAARHKRSPEAINSRLVKLLAPQQNFGGDEDLLGWAASGTGNEPHGVGMVCPTTDFVGMRMTGVCSCRERGSTPKRSDRKRRRSCPRWGYASRRKRR
jgi:hypothetical protein